MDNTISSQIIVGMIGFFGGIVVGYVGHDFMQKSLNMDDGASKNFLVIMVTLIWSISVLAGLVNPMYQVPIPIHALMGSIVGFFFWKPKQ